MRGALRSGKTLIHFYMYYFLVSAEHVIRSVRFQHVEYTIESNVTVITAYLKSLSLFHPNFISYFFQYIFVTFSIFHKIISTESIDDLILQIIKNY